MVLKVVRSILFSIILIMYAGSSFAAKAPDFALFDQAGNMTTLKQYRGKGLVIHFWGTWCPYCKGFQSGLDQLYRKYKGAGLEVLAISIGESSGVNPADILRKQGISFSTVINGDNVAKMYNVPGTPSTYFIDRTGHILWKTHGSDALDPEVEANIRLILSLDQ